MSWRDFFYYYERQRITVIVILILIFISLIANGVIIRRSQTDVVLAYNDSLIEDFELFWQELRVKDSIARRAANMNRTYKHDAPSRYSSQQMSSTTSPDSSSSKIQSSYPRNYSTKLKEGEVISLSSMDTTEWKKIPGIGSAYSSRIVKYQQLLGGFVSKHQLKEVYGIDDEMYERIAPFVAEGVDYQFVYINRLEFNELLRHPYLNYKQVQQIMNLRKKKGKVISLNELRMLSAFTTEDIERLELYLDFSID